MKKFMVLITFVTLSAALFAQTCTVHLYYSGANSTATLQSYLNNPAKPALYNLDAGTKQSLLKYTFFLMEFWAALRQMLMSI